MKTFLKNLNLKIIILLLFILFVGLFFFNSVLAFDPMPTCNGHAPVGYNCNGISGATYTAQWWVVWYGGPGCFPCGGWWTACNGSQYVCWVGGGWDGCYSPVPICNAVCGSADGASFCSSPTSNLCAVGNSSSVSGTGPWEWTCNGTNGGTSISCSASTKSPQCGLSAGIPTLTEPTGATNLCLCGNPSSVSGTGPWTWNCDVGTESVSCSAPLLCVPDTSCANTTCEGQTCDDGCGGLVPGTKKCANEYKGWKEVEP